MTIPIYITSVQERLVVSSQAGTVSGLTFPMSADTQVGDFLLLHFSHQVSANFSDDQFDVTAVSGVWNFAWQDHQNGVTTNPRHMIYWKFATGAGANEATVRVKVTVGVSAGLANAVMNGALHVFRGVNNPGAAPFEAAAVSWGTVALASGEAITTTGADRLVVNLYSRNAAVSGLAASDPPTGGGTTWTSRFYGSPSSSVALALWTANMPAVGTHPGGLYAGASGTAGAYTVRGFALPPQVPAGIVPKFTHHYVMIGNNN